MSQPSLFPTDPVDLAALAALAGRSVPRVSLSGTYVCVAKSTDLFEFGYLVAHWVRPGEPNSEVLEFIPRDTPGRPCPFPRVTADSYAAQVAVHVAIGAKVVSPGRRFRR